MEHQYYGSTSRDCLGRNSFASAQDAAQKEDQMKPSAYRHVAFTIIFLMILMATSTPVDAQLTRGTISGTITDQSRALIAEARVVIRNLATGIERGTTTNDIGAYRFTAVEPGTYSVDFSK